MSLEFHVSLAKTWLLNWPVIIEAKFIDVEILPPGLYLRSITNSSTPLDKKFAKTSLSSEL